MRDPRNTSEPPSVRDAALDPFELGPEASSRSLRSSFRERARALHPDVNAAADAEERFKDLVLAYERAVLALEMRRQRAEGRIPGGEASEPTPPPPTPPARFVCGCCGERFEIPIRCFRCELEVQESDESRARRGLGPQARRGGSCGADPRIARFEQWAETRGQHPRKAPAADPRLPALGLGLLLGYAALLFWVGVLGMAIMVLAYASALVLIMALATRDAQAFARLRRRLGA